MRYLLIIIAALALVGSVSAAGPSECCVGGVCCMARSSCCAK